MTIRFAFAACLLISLCVSAAFAQAQPVERSDWGSFFNQYDAAGTLVIADERGEDHNLQAYDSERAQRRYSPASTYKIPHTLFALDAGAVKDEFEVFAWDGVQRSFEPHNRAQDLRSAMRNSAVWVYQQLTTRIR